MLQFANARQFFDAKIRSSELMEVGIYQKLLLVNRILRKMNGILIIILSYLWIES
jgi:hypothetical protein